MTKLDWGNFDGPKRNPEWKPDLQDLVYTAINFRDDEYGDADDDAGQQIVERLLAALRAERFDKELFNAHRHELLERIDVDQQALAIADAMVRQLVERGAVLAVRNDDDKLVPMALDRQFQLKAGWQTAIAAALKSSGGDHG